MGIVAVFLTWFFILPYVIFFMSPFTTAEADLNKNGILSPTEASHFSDYGERIIEKNGLKCTEYFALKDGLPLKTVCE